MLWRVTHHVRMTLQGVRTMVSCRGAWVDMRRRGMLEGCTQCNGWVQRCEHGVQLHAFRRFERRHNGVYRVVPCSIGDCDGDGAIPRRYSALRRVCRGAKGCKRGFWMRKQPLLWPSAHVCSAAGFSKASSRSQPAAFGGWIEGKWGGKGVFRCLVPPFGVFCRCRRGAIGQSTAPLTRKGTRGGVGRRMAWPKGGEKAFSPPSTYGKTPRRGAGVHAGPIRLSYEHVGAQSAPVGGQEGSSGST